MKKQIIAIGGAAFNKNPAEPSIEQYILNLTGKEKPKVCFLPQASAEDTLYVVSFNETFNRLGAQTTWISLFGRVEPTWDDTLLEQDVIFVGGGNTKSMLALWRAWGMDEVLKKAYEKGIILAGVSAGAICWFEQGITDSVWPMGVLDCMGILKGSCSPHYDSEPERRPVFTQAVNSGQAMPGIALADYTAAHYVDGELSCVLSWAPGKEAFHVSKDTHTPIPLVALKGYFFSATSMQ